MTTKLDQIRGDIANGYGIEWQDQPLLLAVAEAAAEYSKWRIEIQRFDVDTSGWPNVAVNLRVAEIALMAAVGKLREEGQ